MQSVVSCAFTAGSGSRASPTARLRNLQGAALLVPTCAVVGPSQRLMYMCQTSLARDPKVMCNDNKLVSELTQTTVALSQVRQRRPTKTGEPCDDGAR